MAPTISQSDKDSRAAAPTISSKMTTKLSSNCNRQSKADPEFYDITFVVFHATGGIIVCIVCSKHTCEAIIYRYIHDYVCALDLLTYYTYDHIIVGTMGHR